MILPYGASEKRGLGGILLIVAAWLLASPIRAGYYLAHEDMPLITSGGLRTLIGSGVHLSPPSLSFIVPFEIACNVAIIVLNIVVIHRFFTKSETFPKMIIALILATIAYAFVDAKLLEYVPRDAATFLADADDNLSRTVLGGWIWIPYFLLSKRVKNTFVN